MRVVHIVPALFTSDGGIIGGAERHVMELGRHMAGKVPTTILSFEEKERVEIVGDLEVIGFQTLKVGFPQVGYLI